MIVEFLILYVFVIVVALIAGYITKSTFFYIFAATLLLISSVVLGYEGINICAGTEITSQDTNADYSEHSIGCSYDNYCMDNDGSCNFSALILYLHYTFLISGLVLLVISLWWPINNYLEKRRLER